MTENENFENIVANEYPQEAAPFVPLMAGVVYTSSKLHKKGALVLARPETITEGSALVLPIGSLALSVHSISGKVYPRTATYAQEAGVFPNTWSLA